MRAADVMTVRKLEWWVTRSGVFLVAVGIFADVQLIKDIGFGLIIASIVLDLATKGKDYVRFVANMGTRLGRGK